MKNLFVCLAFGLMLLYACRKVADNSPQDELKVTLVSPTAGATISPLAELRFSWSVSSTTTGGTAGGAATYKLKIVEITGGQSPENAFRTNKPHFEKDSLKEFLSSVPYPSTATRLVPGAKYSWAVSVTKNIAGAKTYQSSVSSFNMP